MNFEKKRRGELLTLSTRTFPGEGAAKPSFPRAEKFFALFGGENSNCFHAILYG